MCCINAKISIKIQLVKGNLAKNAKNIRFHVTKIILNSTRVQLESVNSCDLFLLEFIRVVYEVILGVFLL